MIRRRFPIFLALTSALIALTWGSSPAYAGQKDKDPKGRGNTAHAERKAAAQRLKALGLKPGVAGLTAFTAAAPLPGTEGPGGIPHYFGPYGNWAYSPLPSFGISLTLDIGGTGYTSPTVTITDVYGTGIATATVDPLTQIDPVTGAITGITLDPGSSGFHVPFVTITDPTGTSAAATATLDLTTLAGGMQKFVDLLPGIPGVSSFLTSANGYDGITGANNLGQYIPLAVPEPATFSGQQADYYEIALVEFYEKMHTNLMPTKQRGYVQLSTTGAGIPLLQVDGVTPILKPDGTQAIAVDKPHFLGPIILAKGRVHGIPNALPLDPGTPVPVRIKFYNLLPAGAGGDLFIPVDETVMGSGLGPALPGTAGDKYTQNRATIHLHGNNTVWISDGNVHQWITPADEITPYPKGVSVRNVPDMLSPTGAVDCDVAPAGKNSSGCMTFFYTNAQSARLQFYHDHAMGITRLNVYAGEAAGYVITDAVEQDMINGTNVSGVNCFDPPTCSISKKVLPDIGIPLVLQDRTWVEASTVFAQDPTWNGGTGTRDALGNLGGLTPAVDGDYWYPHVYMSAQNPWDLTGTNAYGRWHYGPWFNPPVPECVNGGPVGCIELGPVPNEYYDPVNAPWEPPMRPGVPNPSIPGEGFMDTPTVNGTAYPVLKVEPKDYRFRVLSAANDRMFNLQLYVAADKNSWTPGTGPAAPGTPTVLCDGVMTRPDLTLPPPADCTEVKMVPVGLYPANQYADWPSGIPDPATKGPDWILIGTEGGLMPKPVVVPQQPVGWNLNPTTFNFGTVNQHSLLVGSAERADVVVDFSAYAGQTLILYNDAPAAFPAGVPTYDYFTGVGDLIDVGGAPDTRPGYGPNTRTIMQIQVGTTVTTPTTDVTLANLQAVFAKTASKRGVFEVSQDPIIIPQAAFNSAYNASFPTSAADQFIQIADTQKTFQPIDENGVLQPAVTKPLEMKAMHDEMGGVYDTMFGRMSGMLGLTNPTSPVHVLIPYGLASPPTDLVQGSLEGTPVGVMPDGTQIWRIFHNGVDTHTIHTHLFHSQLINRLGQDGILLENDPTELGWKDTFRVNPLEITYLAMRPTVPTPAQLPFEPPDSIRLIDPTLPEGATLIPPAPAGWFDPAGNAITEILNHPVNFGWEYVWHCHILAHEEMDMMHSLVFAVPPKAPSGLTAAVTGTANNPRVSLIWTDNSLKETQFTIQRATNAGFTTGVTTFNVAANPLPVPTNLNYVDTTVAKDTKYWYRVFTSAGLVGDTLTPNFPTMAAESVSNTFEIQVGTAPGAPAAPTGLTATPQAGPQVSLAWTDNATNESGFVVERCTGVDCGLVPANFAQIATPGPRTNGPATVTYIDATVTAGNTYSYQVGAVNASFPAPAAYTNIATASLPAVPAAPTGFTVAAVKANGNNYTATLNWAHPGGANLTNFTVQRATNLSFTTGLSTSTYAAAARSATQTITKNTVYYYRIRANNSISGSSAWTNAQPYPIRTGP